jgi:hypothetical protein
MAKQDYYTLLGVSRNAKEADIKKATVGLHASCIRMLIRETKLQRNDSRRSRKPMTS